MFSGYTSGEYQSVMFFVDGHVDREMLFTEFEAILDNFVPIPSFADKNIQAVCVGINGQLKIISAVFFLLRFDSAGNADSKWNIPLQELTDQAELGPDLGAGPIRLCCRSQCPVDWHVQGLWDPDMNQQPNAFVVLRDLVKRNRLGFKELPFDVDEIHDGDRKYAFEIPVLTGEALVSNFGGSAGEISDADKSLAHSLIQYIRKKVAVDNSEQLENLERQHQLQLTAEKNKAADELREARQIHSDELRQMQTQLESTQAVIDSGRQAMDALRRQLQDQQQITDKLRDSFHKQLEESKQVEGDQIEKLKANFEAELEIRVQGIVKELEQQLDGKDIEISYCKEQQTVLRDEIDTLHREHAKLIKEAGEQFITRLRDNKVTFMAYHLGAGNITIDLEDIGTYLENPLAYAATMCKVTETDYRSWLTHYNNPVCGEFSTAKGEECGKKLRRVDVPAQFVTGRSDRCPLHWSFSAVGDGNNKPE
ncbi:MAG: hypothetical protein R3E63_05680 [Pseudomonadales bacterium]